MKGSQIRKEENKMLLFEDDKMVSIENPKESSKQNKEIKTGPHRNSYTIFYCCFLKKKIVKTLEIIKISFNEWVLNTLVQPYYEWETEREIF